MQTIAKSTYKYWQDGEFWIGYLEEFPDYMTQGDTLENLKEHLVDLYKELSNGTTPHVRRVGDLDIK